MSRLGALLLLLLVMGLPSEAHAGWKRERAVAIAEIVWNHPCDGEVELRWIHFDDIHPGWYSGPCQITYNTAFRQDWWGFCTTTLHEYGHVAGVGHTTNQRSIMYERPPFDKRCANNGRDYLLKHGAKILREAPYILPPPRLNNR
jgi:hypothetical protein